MRIIWIAAANYFIFGILGCNSRPQRIVPPRVDPSVAGQRAIQAFDEDNDGLLTRQELATCPALLVSFDGLDSDSNRSLSEVEIETRIREWQRSKAGLVSCRLRILLDGRPLSGAEVLLEPVDFLQPGVLPASGTTTSQGFVQLSVAKEHLPAPNLQAMNWGFYNVRVVQGDDKNSQLPINIVKSDSLGVEVSAIGKNETVLKLKSNG